VISLVYKICLIGTHGTGKTSLAASVEGELKRRGIDSRFLRETSAEAKEIGLQINTETTLDAQMYILHTQFAQELRYANQHKNPPTYNAIICDRGPDNYCYLKHNLGESPEALSMTLNHLKLFPYTQMYLLPIVQETIQQGEGVRSLDKQFQQHMDQEIRAFLNQHQLPCYELPLPQTQDPLRREWLDIIIQKTMQDLKNK